MTPEGDPSTPGTQLDSAMGMPPPPEAPSPAPELADVQAIADRLHQNAPVHATQTHETHDTKHAGSSHHRDSPPVQVLKFAAWGYFGNLLGLIGKAVSSIYEGIDKWVTDAAGAKATAKAPGGGGGSGGAAH